MKNSTLKSIHPTLIEEFPKLAWGAVIRPNSDYVELLHGSSVEVSKNGFSEGAWNGNFSLENLFTSKYIVGSGGIIDRGSLVIRTPTHTLERIWVITSKSKTYISNSLPLVLCISDSTLNNKYPYYEADFLSFLLGPKGIKTRTILNESKYISQYIDSTITLSSNGVKNIAFNNHQAQFKYFETYYDHLKNVASFICQNAESKLRNQKYKPLASVSKGYDSPACSVIAKYCGAENAITYSKSRSGFADDDDDGSSIAKTIGLIPTVLQRDEYLSNDNFLEAIFLSSGGGGEDVILSSAQTALDKTVLFTGFLGDTIWGLNGIPERSKVSRITFPGGGSLAEFRLNANFIHLPVPILDLRSHQFILDISNSKEMSHWRIGGGYDRPIPRRIAESAGVPRNYFGRSKMAVTSPFYYDDSPLTRLSDKSKQSFLFFAENNFPKMAKTNTLIKNYFLKTLLNLRRSIFWKTDHINFLNNFNDLIEPSLSDKGRRGITKELMLVHWGVHIQLERYRILMSNIKN